MDILIFSFYQNGLFWTPQDQEAFHIYGYIFPQKAITIYLEWSFLK